MNKLTISQINASRYLDWMVYNDKNPSDELKQQLLNKKFVIAREALRANLKSIINE